MAVKNLPSTFLLLSLCCPYAFSNVTRLRPVSLAPSENMNSAANTSIPQTVSFDSITVTAQASLVQNLTLVNVLIKNGSPRTLAVSPHLFSAADGNLLMLKLMEPASVTSILQADLAAIQAQYANSMAYQQPSGPDPFTQTLSSYMFGQMGLKGDTRDLAANLTASVIQNMNRDPQMAFLPPPDITPSFFFRSIVDLVNAAKSDLLSCHVQNMQYCRGQSGLSMVDVTDGADINVGFRPIKFLFSHFILILPLI